MGMEVVIKGDMSSVIWDLVIQTLYQIVVGLIVGILGAGMGFVMLEKAAED
jgi:NhaP-type Na+/H+ and K+/H+ antiporter